MRNINVQPFPLVTEALIDKQRNYARPRRADLSSDLRAWPKPIVTTVDKLDQRFV